MPNQIPEFEELPPVMVSRARWARQTILEHPELAVIDEDELLAWVFNEEDGVWYSIAGNYSSMSPREKMEKRRIFKEQEAAYRETQKRTTMQMLAKQEYYSVVRNRILERDNHTCRQCSRSIGVLEVHHIVKQREQRIDTDDNLITLCASCHRKLDRNDYGTYADIERGVTNEPV